MNKLQRIENKMVRGLKRLGSKAKYSKLKRYVRTSVAYELRKDKEKEYKK